MVYISIIIGMIYLFIGFSIGVSAAYDIHYECRTVTRDYISGFKYYLFLFILICFTAIVWLPVIVFSSNFDKRN